MNLSSPLSKETLEFLKSISVRSYGTAKELIQICQAQGQTCELIEDTESDGQVFIIGSPSYTLIAFRGTNSWTDIWIDLKCLPVSTPFGRAHGGFVHAFQRLWPAIRTKIDPSKPLLITGHSLGGALAQLCALWAAHDLNKQPHYVITFAQPRVGSFGIAKRSNELLADRFYRITKKLDIVPRLPPYFLLYTHPKSTAYKKSSDGGAVPQNFYDRHFWNLLSLFCALAFICFAYIVFQNHGISDY